MRKPWVLLTALIVALTFSACNTSEAPSVDPDLPTIPEDTEDIDEVQAQNFGKVRCFTDYWTWCLGLEHGDGFNHSWNHYERVEVRRLQRLLNYNGFNAGAVDGYFGWGTYHAVIRAQEAYGLSRDGKVGKCTWTSLFVGYGFCW